jgi:ATP-grasp domain
MAYPAKPRSPTRIRRRGPVPHSRILVVATQSWPLGARVAIALTKVGFAVAAVSPLGALIRKPKSIVSHYTYWPWRPLTSLMRAICACSPRLLVCVDDEAVRQLHSLHQFLTRRRGVDDASILKLIEDSLGDPAGFVYAREKSKFILSAQSIGVRCPKTTVVSDKRALELGLHDTAYPLVVKADGTYAGMGVRLAGNEDQARKLVDVLGRQGHAVCLQEYIVGRPANRAVVCYSGKVLAGISVEAIETKFAFGPASVVRVIDHPEITAICNSLVSHFGLSGFAGFDFILDSENRPWLLELNARVTPTCHLNLADGTDLASALGFRLSGIRTTRASPAELERTIVLFPQGMVPSRHSLNLSSIYLSSYHDVPWDEPDLVRASIDSAVRRGFVRRLMDRLSSLRREAQGKLGVAHLGEE